MHERTTTMVSINSTGSKNTREFSISLSEMKVKIAMQTSSKREV